MLCLDPNNGALQDICQGTWKAAVCGNTHELLGFFFTVSKRIKSRKEKI